MRAWWSMLFVPKNDTNLRSRYDCSLLCFEEPIQNVASGPDSSWICGGFCETSFSAGSHEMRCHFPPTSFIGYFGRCESCVMPCWGMDAPLAQCEPRLMGESKTGSCRTQTPF